MKNQTLNIETQDQGFSSILEKMRREDHDSLIRIETNLENLSKLVSSMGDGLTARLTDHELRLQKIETINNQVDPVKMCSEFETLKNTVHDFTVTANVYRVIAGFIGGLIMFVLTQLPNILRAFDIIK